jgi:hypothetical protein
MKRAALALLVAALVAPATLPAQDMKDFLGEWESTIETERGTFTTTYSFWMDGDVLKGGLSGRMGETEIDEVTYMDGKISFSITRSRQGNEMTLTYSAKIVDGTMQGTMTTPRGEREFTATRVET